MFTPSIAVCSSFYAINLVTISGAHCTNVEKHLKAIASHKWKEVFNRSLVCRSAPLTALNFALPCLLVFNTVNCRIAVVCEESCESSVRTVAAADLVVPMDVAGRCSQCSRLHQPHAVVYRRVSAPGHVQGWAQPGGRCRPPKPACQEAAY